MAGCTVPEDGSRHEEVLQALFGSPQGDEPQAKIAVGLRQLTGGRVQNDNEFSLLFLDSVPPFFISVVYFTM